MLRSTRARWWWRTGLLAGAAAVAAGGTLPAANATPLPDGRGYEMVSPSEKNGADILPFLLDTRSAVDGNRVVFSSVGAFGDAAQAKSTLHYVGMRTGGGWSTTLPAPALNNGPGGVGESFVELLTPDLRYYVITKRDGDATNLSHLYAGGEGQALQPLAPIGTPQVSRAVGVSDDFRHIVFESSNRLTPDAPIDAPDPVLAQASNVYESVDGQLRLVSVLPDGRAAPGGSFAGFYQVGVNPPVGGATRRALTQDQHVVSSDGSHIFWTSVPDGQLYVRVDGTRTVHVSASQRRTPDPDGPEGAGFRYATPDGSKVFFTSTEKLTDDSTADGGAPQYADLYVYDVDTGSLKDLSVATISGESANVQGVIGISNDGGTVYFTAMGHLTSDAVADAQTDAIGNPRPQLYKWHNGVTTYVAPMGAPFESSLEPGNWSIDNLSGVKPSHVSSDGRFMLVKSILPLAGRDTAGRIQIYRYDAQSDDIVCVSCDPTGRPPTVDSSTGVVAAGFSQFGIPFLSPFQPQNMSSDGSRVFFETRDALVPADTNGRIDVYEWEDGQTHLISSGNSIYDSHFADASPSGDDVFFTTRERLVQQDQDNNADLYDARVGGGFAESPAPVVCSGDGCQGEGSAAPQLPTPSSATIFGAGNVSPAGARPRTRLSVAPLSAAARARFAKTGRIALRVKATRVGAITVIARAKLHGRTVIVGKASKRQRGKGTTRLTIALSKAARQQLRKRHRLVVKLKVSMPGATSRLAAVTLTSRSR